MRIADTDSESSGVSVPKGWAAVKDSEAFWGNRETHGRRLLKGLLEGIM